MPDEDVIEERIVKVKRENKKNKDDGLTKEGDGNPSGMANPEDNITNT